LSARSLSPVLRTTPGLCGPAFLGGLTTRLGFPKGDAASPQDGRAQVREVLAKALQTTPENFAWCKQVHGGTVVEARTSGFQGEGDALVSRDSSLGLLISVADCIPVLLWNPRTPGTRPAAQAQSTAEAQSAAAFGVAHAGWRGLLAKILPATVDALALLGTPPLSLRAWIGPSICIEHFEVGEEVAGQFPERFVERRDEWPKSHLDLKSYAVHQLQEAGLVDKSIAVCPDCTYAQADFYHSYRRDQGICGRQLAYLLPTSSNRT